MKTSTIIENWKIGTRSSVLEQIHENDVNIAIFERDTSAMAHEIATLTQQNIEFRSSGDKGSILAALDEKIRSDRFSAITEDIKTLLDLFHQVTGSPSFRLLLATVDGNMCGRYHTDINDLRMLCTYYGPGTMWLSEDNINREALDTLGDNESIVMDEARVQQAKTGSVLILKGALYPYEGTRAIVHRSPTIEEGGQKRLLLRIDTQAFLNY